MLAIENLSKSFAAHHVLSGLNLSIAEGALTAIIGPNGCGKSTLFNLITGELIANGGGITFNGQSLLSKKPRQIARLGILRKFQIPGIYPSLSVEEHLRLATVISPTTVSKKQRQHTIEKMGLTAILSSPASVLATGQKQWLELAMLVLMRPTLLLLDEPIAGMTTDEAMKTLDILQQLNADGLTIVTIEHNMDFVRQLTNDIVVMMDGGVAMRADYRTIAANQQIREGYLGSLYV